MRRRALDRLATNLALTAEELTLPDLQDDPRYCGRCDRSCQPGQVCVSGDCQEAGDCNDNGVPDECEFPPCDEDLNDNFCVRINEILNPEEDRYPKSKAS